MPRAAAYGGDLVDTDGLSLVRVLGISQRAQHSPMLTGHAPKASGPFGRGPSIAAQGLAARVRHHPQLRLIEEISSTVGGSAG
jgi:hypothetical protein